jgi:hypothetical protein
MARKPGAAELAAMNCHVRVPHARARRERYVSALHQKRSPQVSLSSLTLLLTSTHYEGSGEVNPASLGYFSQFEVSPSDLTP